jgi:hypothetical protein
MGEPVDELEGKDEPVGLLGIDGEIDVMPRRDQREVLEARI